MGSMGSALSFKIFQIEIEYFLLGHIKINIYAVSTIHLFLHMKSNVTSKIFYHF